MRKRAIGKTLKVEEVKGLTTETVGWVTGAC